MNSTKWLEYVAESWAEGHRTGSALAESLQKKLGLASLQTAEALVEAVDELTAYAGAEVGEADVLELEDFAVARSRTVMRGLLEAKLQQRVDALDAAEKKRAATAVARQPNRRGGPGGVGRAGSARSRSKDATDIARSAQQALRPRKMP